MSIAFRFAARSDVGLIRRSNQDSGYAGPHLCVLADGMGGPAGGDLASSIAVAHLAPLDNDVHSADSLLSLLREALDDAHAEMVQRSESAPELSGLGTTCIAMLRTGNKIAMVHIGDSRAYLLRGNVLTQVTTDHSFVQYLMDTGQITPEEAEHHPQRSVILRVLGDSPGPVNLDESVREAIPGDRWLLCSDGLHGVVSGETIANVLANTPDPGTAADELVSLSLRGGAPDNVTVVVVDVVDTDDPEVDPPDTYPQIVGAAGKNRLDRTKGSEGAAGDAAELTKDSLPDFPEIDEEASEKPATKRKWGKWLVALLILLAIAGGFGGAYWWTQTRYFVQIDREVSQVCIYRGIPQQLGSFKLYSKVECSNRIDINKLGTELRSTLQDTPITRSSLPAARAYIDDVLLPQVLQKEKEEAQRIQGNHSLQPGGSGSGGSDSSNGNSNNQNNSGSNSDSEGNR